VSVKNHLPDKSACNYCSIAQSRRIRAIFYNYRAFFSIIFTQITGFQTFFPDNPANHSTIVEKSLNAEAFFWKVASWNCIIVVISVDGQTLSRITQTFGRNLQAQSLNDSAFYENAQASSCNEQGKFTYSIVWWKPTGVPPNPSTIIQNHRVVAKYAESENDSSKAPKTLFSRIL
jgi:hypothetical protein